MGKSKELYTELMDQQNMISKNTRIGGYDIRLPNGVEIWIAGSYADAKNELRIELKQLNNN